jgi:hypothetical protein
MPDVHDALNTPSTNVHDALNTPRVHDALTTDTQAWGADLIFDELWNRLRPAYSIIGPESATRYMYPPLGCAEENGVPRHAT